VHQGMMRLLRQAGGWCNG